MKNPTILEQLARYDKMTGATNNLFDMLDWPNDFAFCPECGDSLAFHVFHTGRCNAIEIWCEACDYSVIEIN